MASTTNPAEIVTSNAASLAVAMSVFLSLVGCGFGKQGKQLPSPSNMTEDTQYFPVGTEFKLPPEAAALKATREEEKRRKEELEFENI